MPCGVRIYTMLLYLNDVEEGGETQFDTLDIRVISQQPLSSPCPALVSLRPSVVVSPRCLSIIPDVLLPVT